MGKPLPISHEEMRSMLVDHLTQNPDGQVNDLRRGLGPLAAARFGITPDQNGDSGLILGMDRTSVFLHEDNCGQAESVLWDLIVEGVVRPGLRNKGGTLPHFYVTDFGKEKLKDPNTPYDPDGYLKRLRDSIPSIDPVIMTYLTESLHTFRIGCLLSATITLGCAAEKAILLLVEAYGNALPTGRKEQFKKKTEDQGIKIQFAEISKMVESHVKGLLPSEIKDGVDFALTTVFNMFRVHRNDAGHPTGITLSREQVHALITSFPMYIKKVYELLGWIRSQGTLP